MKHISLSLSICLCALFLFCCEQTNAPKIETGIAGQIYEVGAPAEPAGWTPPPLRGVRTIVVSDTNSIELRRLDTDNMGAFAVALPAGGYLLLVKDTVRAQGENGPFIVLAGQVSTVKVYHDNGMR
jgi:hypothetical protein